MCHIYLQNHTYLWPRYLIDTTIGTVHVTTVFFFKYKFARILKNIAVSIGRRLGAALCGVRSHAEKRDFLSKHGLPSEPTQIPIGRVPRALSLTVKRKNYFPPPSSVEIKNEWRCVSSPGLHLCDVYRDEFINFFLCTNNFFVHQFDNAQILLPL
jgi:hypothetical protein